MQFESDQKFDKILQKPWRVRSYSFQGVFSRLGKALNAYELAFRIIRSAKTTHYPNRQITSMESTLNSLGKKKTEGWSNPAHHIQLQTTPNWISEKAKWANGAILKLKSFDTSHDSILWLLTAKRFIILVLRLKDLGKKWFASSTDSRKCDQECHDLIP